LPNLKQTVWLRVAGFCGVITPIIVLSLILLAISFSPWFSWTENALSDLGVHEVAILFNSSLMVGGFLIMIFASGLMRTQGQSRVGFIGSFALILTAMSLFAVGLFSESAGRIHFYVSVSFFTLGILSMFLIGIALIRDSSERKIGAFSILAGVFAAAVWIVFWNFPHKGDAIPEILSSLAASTWAIVMGIRLLMLSSKS